MHQHGLISRINTTQDQSLDICAREAKEPYKISLLPDKPFFSLMLQHISPAQPLSTFVGPFEEIKEKRQLWRAMSAGWPHSQRAPSHCLLFNPRLVLLFNFSFGRYPVFFFSPGGGSRMVSSVLIEARSMITFGHLQWKGISAALAGTRCIMDQCKIPPFDCYSVLH